MRENARSASGNGCEREYLNGRDGQCASANCCVRGRGRGCGRENVSGLRGSVRGHDHDPHEHARMPVGLPC